MRCPRCGNENPATNRFCGMCGTTLLPAPAPAPVSATRTAGSTATSTSVSAPVPPARTTVPPASPSSGSYVAPAAIPLDPEPEDSGPMINGPSFLGLNRPGPSYSPSSSSSSGSSSAGSSGSSRRSGLSIAPDSHSSSNLDYLLEDEEEPRGGGAGKAILIVVALLLAVGLGYMRWRNQGLPWMSSGAKKPAASDTTAAPDANGNTSTTPSAGDTTAASPAGSGAAGTSATPPSSSATGSASGAAPGSISSEPAKDAANSNTPAGSPSDSKGDKSPASPDTAAPAGDASGAKPAASKKDVAKNDSSEKDDTDAADSGSDESTPAPAASASKPKAAVAPAKPSPARVTDPVSEAQKYIYGKGVSQDCDRGLRLLKPAANNANSKAMIQMGAMYSAGLCTPRDLPTAYRWFAMALRKEPDNELVQTDLQKLWGEMTQPERQLAIRLTQ